MTLHAFYALHKFVYRMQAVSCTAVCQKLAAASYHAVCSTGISWRHHVNPWPILDPYSHNCLFGMQAALIEYNLEAVDAAINAVREALASGLDWRELGQMIKAERRAGNPVAGLIDSLALDKNKITVVLENFLDEQEADDEAMTRPATKVIIRLSTDQSCSVM